MSRRDDHTNTNRKTGPGLYAIWLLGAFLLLPVLALLALATGVDSGLSWVGNGRPPIALLILTASAIVAGIAFAVLLTRAVLTLLTGLARGTSILLALALLLPFRMLRWPLVTRAKKSTGGPMPPTPAV